MSSRRRFFSGLFIAFVIIATLLAVGIAYMGPQFQSAGQQDAIKAAVLAEANAAILAESVQTQLVEPIVSDIAVSGEWAFGILVIRAPDPALQIHAEPDLRLFLTRREESNGEVKATLEYTPEFYALLEQVPSGLIPAAGLDSLRSAAAVARGEQATRALNYALPWQSGQTWTMTGGPHPDSGVGSARPWSALDLAYGPGVGVVRAAESGVVWRSSDCPNFIRVDHAGGYRTGYYHVVNERVVNGQTVIRGDALADEGMGLGCGGYTTGPHVHFSLRYFDTRLNIAGNEFAGWRVLDGSSPYNGCMLRLRDNTQMCTPRAQITYEDGVLPVISDLRYDYNFDGRPDLWVVDQRPTDGGTVTLRVYNGSAFTSTLNVPRSSLPPQPVELNTAFMAGDYNGDSVPDLWLLHRRFDSSNTTALRILDGSNPTYLIQDTPTALPLLSDDVRFGLADYNRDGVYDIYAVIPDYILGTLRVVVVDGSNPMQQIVSRNPAMPMPRQVDDIAFAFADYDADGRPDLWAINPRNLETGSVSVTILKGNGFSNLLAETGTALPLQSTDPDKFAFIVTDYNRDGTPDLWHLDRTNGTLKILSGKNFTTMLYNGPTGTGQITNARYQVLGSDRARLRIPPQAPRLLGPPNNTTIVDQSVTLRFTTSQLSRAMILKLYDENGTLLLKRKYPKNDKIVCIGDTCTVDTAAIGVTLRDGQPVLWNVTAKNPYGTTVSATRTLIIDLPGPVTIQSPLDGQLLTAQPTFTWTTRPTASTYILIVKNKAAGTKSKFTVQATECGETCAVNTGIPLENGSYWVRVNAKDGLGGKSKGPKVHFAVDAPPPVPPDQTQNPLPVTVTSAPPVIATETITAVPSMTPTTNPNATLPVPASPVGFQSP